MPQGNGGARGRSGSGGSPRHDDLEDLLRRSQDKLGQVMPGGSGLFLLPAVVIIAVAAFFAFRTDRGTYGC
jgi:membrane protease subunit HflK